jgi:hypothetical protein
MSTEVVDHPALYQSECGIEAIEVMERYGLGPHLFVAMKHLLRAGKKGDVLTDLKKADWYMTRLFGRTNVAAFELHCDAEGWRSPDEIVESFALTGNHAEAVRRILLAAAEYDEDTPATGHLAQAYRALGGAIAEAEAAAA